MGRNTKTPLKIAVGSLIREYRERLGLSLNGLGRVVNVNGNYLGCIERGNRKPSLVLFFKLCDTFCVTPEWMLHAIEKRAPPGEFDQASRDSTTVKANLWPDNCSS